VTSPRFIADVNVGRLAKWLRAMGYDVLYLPDVEDGALVERAMVEGRVILARDTHIVERRPVTSGRTRTVLLAHDDLHGQLRQVVKELGLEADRQFSRCIRCNAPLLSVAKAEVAERVPPYVYRTQEDFSECPRCHKVYWRGSHWHNMRMELEEVRSEAQ